MTEFNSIGNPALATGLGRLFSVDRPRVGMISPDIQLTTSLWERPEFWALAGGGLAAANFSMAAQAATQGQAVIYNPTGSGVLITVDQFGICNDTAAAELFNWGVCLAAGVPLSVTGSWSNKDLRRSPTAADARGSLAGIVRISVPTGGGAMGQVHGWVQVPANNTFVLPVDYVLPPGWAFMVATGVVNKQLRGWFSGRERPAPQTKLSLF